jgi:hypothetical protein
MKKPIHLLVAVIMLFLFSLSILTYACPPPDCDPCYEWDYQLEDCVYTCEGWEYCCSDGDDGTCCDLTNGCNICDGASCNYYCGPSDACCTGLCCDCCDDTGFQCCSSPDTCCGPWCCEYNSCEKCNDVPGDLQCVSKCKTSDCEVCNGSGTCISSCLPNQVCINGVCCNYACGPNKDVCCDNPCCDQYGGSLCTYTWDPLPIPCSEVGRIDDISCLEEGVFCGWKITSGPSNHDTACVPSDLNNGYCVIAWPMVCTNVFIPFQGSSCWCLDKTGLVETETFGTRKFCE